VHHGFDERVAALSGLYGAGVYFANQSCKAAQYASANPAGEKVILISRVTLGEGILCKGPAESIEAAT
jgi:hypothetical protein